jgi:hypothetical protein
MKIRILGMTFLLAGAGSVAHAQALKGSDTLEEVTKDVLAQCAAAAGVTYDGGGSSSGEAAMVGGLQQIAPMSRFLKNDSGVACGTANADTAEGLTVGLDGISVFSNSTQAAACGNGLAYTSAVSFPVVQYDSHGQATGNADTSCVGCSGGTYTITDWRDVLALIFGGQHHDAAKTIDCGSNVRRTLADNWAKLFEAGCAGGSCTKLNHAWRRSDLSGTTDTFVGLVGFTNSIASKAGPGKINPFCNAAGAGAIVGGGSDFLDRDPIRRACTGDGGTAGSDQVCGIDGTLGLVTVVFVPELGTTAENFPTQSCDTGKFRLVRPAPGNDITVCPSGKPRLFGKCFNPYHVINPAGDPNDPTNQDYNCLAKKSPVHFGAGTVTNPLTGATQAVDGRFWNAFAKASDGSYRKDANGRYVTGAYYRVHTTTSAGTVTGCTLASSTEEIGCLSNADPCSIGFAGREGEVAGTDTALSVAGKFPTVGNIQALVATPSDPSDDYVLARKLYVNTLIGFENVTGGQLELAKCFGNNNITRPIINNRHFVELPHGVECADFVGGGCSTVDACANNPAGLITNSY